MYMYIYKIYEMPISNTDYEIYSYSIYTYYYYDSNSF